MTETNGKGAPLPNVQEPERTRFLPRLDAMVKQDMHGAATDMIQKLTELGYIQTVEASAYLSEMKLRNDPDAYRKSAAHDLARRVGTFLGEQGHLRFAEDKVKVAISRFGAQPGDSQLRAQVDILVVK